MYKKFLMIFALIAISTRLGVHYYSTNELFNYLLVDSSSLNQHIIINDKKQKESILILGSSGVAGGNVPLFSNLTDQMSMALPQFNIYNLAKLQGSIVDVLINLKEAIKLTKPRMVIIGISPSLFHPVPRGKNIAKNLESISNDIKFDYFKKLKNKKSKNFLGVNHYALIEFPLKSILIFKSKLYHLKQKIYGDQYNKQKYSKGKNGIEYSYNHSNPSIDIFRSINKILSAYKIKGVIYFEPINNPDISFPSTQYQKFKSYLTMRLRSSKFKILDYSTLIPWSSEYFEDYIHLSPKGYKELSVKLIDDIKGDL